MSHTRENLVSDIPAVDGKTVIPFLQCILRASLVSKPRQDVTCLSPLLVFLISVLLEILRSWKGTRERGNPRKNSVENPPIGVWSLVEQKICET
jgi:hypothetical protein